MKHTIELTYEELVTILCEKWFLSVPKECLQVKITNYPSEPSVGNTDDSLWYPDDSGEWKEHDGSDNIPEGLHYNNVVVWMTPEERSNKKMKSYTEMESEYIGWEHVVAYKKIN